MRNYHLDGTKPEGDRAIFVFGSNLAGVHGAGAARVALLDYDAVIGHGAGFAGSSYAIPTKDGWLNTMPLGKIRPYVEEFLDFAREHAYFKFFVTRIGCGLAGYQDFDIAPMFRRAPANCDFAIEWREFLELTTHRVYA